MSDSGSMANAYSEEMDEKESQPMMDESKMSMLMEQTIMSPTDDRTLVRMRTSMAVYRASLNSSPSDRDSLTHTEATTDTQQYEPEPNSVDASLHAQDEKYNEYNISEESEDRMSSDMDGCYDVEQHHVVPSLTDIAIVNDFTCCLSFLLHDKSPLWQLSATQGTSFQARCAFWQSNYKKHAYSPPSHNAQHVLWKLAPDDDRIHRWPQLMQFYTSWNPQKRDSSHVKSLHWTQQDIQHIKTTLDAISGRQSSVPLSAKYSIFNRMLSSNKSVKTFKSYPAGCVPLSAQNSITMTQRSRATQLTMLTGQMREFVAIETVNGMLNYLRKYKITSMQYHDIVDEHDLNIRKLANPTLSYRMKRKMASIAYEIKQQMIACTRDIGKSMKESVETVGNFQNDDKFQLLREIGRLPMTQWQWIHVVYWCEKILPPNLKSFAVIFHEWRIDGNELMLMEEKHIECLIKCSYEYPHNSNLVKLLNPKDINRLITEIRKCLIQSAIMCQYDLYWSVLRQIKLNKHHPLFAKVWNIIHLVRFLRPGYAQGSKALWKMNAIYFSKIDNILSILMVSTKCQKLFQRSYPRFIFNDPMHASFKNVPQKQQNKHDRITNHTKQEPTQHDIASIYMEQMTKHDADCLDTIGNKCCSEDSKCPNRYCFQFVHDFDRTYCKVMIMLCLCVTLCCVFIICFMSYKMEEQINKIMLWSSESIGDRTARQMHHELYLVQMVLGVALSRLYSSDLAINAASYNDGRYDRFFTQYTKYKSAKTNVHSLYLYELQNHTLIGSWCDSNDTLLIHVFDPKIKCAIDYVYDRKTERRDTNSIQLMLCNSDTNDPTTKAWYTLAMDNDIGFMGWTEIYEISEGVMAMSIVHNVLYNDVRLILFSELLVDNLQSLLSNTNINGIMTYITSAKGNIVACANKTKTNDSLIVKSAIKIHEANISQHMAMKIDHYDVLLYPLNDEHALVVMRNTNTYLDDVASATKMSIILYLGSLSLILLVICFMGSQLRNLQKVIEYKSKDDSYTSIRHRCFCQHKTLLWSTFCYCAVLFITIYCIWHNAIEHSLDEILDEFLLQEYYAVYDATDALINIVETITDVVEERFSRNTKMSLELIADEFSTETETFFTHLMDTFRWTNNEYYAHMIYIATPDGKFIGLTKDANDTEGGMLLLKRDASTYWDRVSIRVNDNQIVTRNTYFDPRCRKWYKRTLEYMFDGDINSAFAGSDNIVDFYLSKDSETATQTEECEKIREHYLDIWNVDQLYMDIDAAYMMLGALNKSDSVDSDTMNNIYRNHVFNKTTITCANTSAPLLYDTLWSKYIFVSGASGWTASKPIIDEATGDILAIIGVDLTFKELSAVLNSTNDYNNGEKEWISWIFSGDGDEQRGYDMIASSKGDVMYVTAYNDEHLWPYDALNHPNDIIRMDSKQIINSRSEQCGSNALPVNTQLQNHKVSMPLYSAFLLAGRLLSYPVGANGVEIDWIIAKSIDINHFIKDVANDTAIVAFIIICILLLIWFIEKSIQNTAAASLSDTNDNNDDDDDDDTEFEEDEKQKLRDLHHELENIVQGSSAEMWGLFLQYYFSNDSENGLLTVNIAKEFMAKEANKHISCTAGNHLTFLLCTLQLQQKWKEFRILSFISSSRYNSCIVFCLFIHCLCSLYLPSTAAALKENTINTNILTLIYVLIIIEIIDVLLVGIIARYIEFMVVNRRHLANIYRIQYGFHHKYVSQIERKSLLWLMLFGTKYSYSFLIHLLFVLLIVMNTLLMITKQIAIFEYYIPIIPLLIAVRCRAIREFCIHFAHILYSAKHIFVSYLFFITIISLFAQSIFKDVLIGNNSSDTFSDISRAWITSFVFVVTGDNYNDVVYNALSNDDTITILNLIFFIIIAVIGLFFFIPVLIHKFQIAFNDSLNLEQNQEAKRKTNSYIAAFIMLDMNDNRRVSMNEYQHLMNTSRIAYNIFSCMDSDGDESLSLHEFVALWIQNNHILSIQQSPRYHRCQAYLECNWFRKPNNRLYTLIFLIIPAVAVSLIRGLYDSKFASSMIAFFFICNFIDINFRLCAFGISRYGNLNKYQNPAFVEQAITIWKHIHMQHTNEDNEDDDEEEDAETSLINIKLTHIEKQWVSQHLCATQPLSTSQQSTISILHKFELYIIWFGFIGFIASHVAPSLFRGYRYLFLQIYLLRLLSLIEVNQKVVILMFSIMPHFVYLFAFVMLFIFIWARIGCSLFATRTDYISKSMYGVSGAHSFDDLSTSILLLIQLMFGKGWHQIMYLYMIATHRTLYAAYFIFYVVFVTLVISNIFIGLFLSKMNELDMKQFDYPSNQYNFKQVATKRKQILANKAHDLQNALKETLKQIQQIDNVLQKDKEDKKDTIEMKQMHTKVKTAKLTLSSYNSSARKTTQL